jgi:hypothetical protein
LSGGVSGAGGAVAAQREGLKGNGSVIGKDLSERLQHTPQEILSPGIARVR